LKKKLFDVLGRKPIRHFKNVYIFYVLMLEIFTNKETYSIVLDARAVGLTDIKAMVHFKVFNKLARISNAFG